MSSSIRMTPQVQAVVRALFDAPDGARLYGRQISTTSGYQSGTVYPILERLLRYGWVANEWEERSSDSAGRPLRRYFWLTGEGRAGAAAAFERLRGQVLKRSLKIEGGAVEVRVLTRLGDTGAFEAALAVFLDSCPHVLGGYTVSCYPVEG